MTKPTRKLPANFHSHEYGGIQAPHWLMLWPAYTVLPFLRSPLGYEIVQPSAAITRALALIFFPSAIAWFYVAITATPLPNSAGLLFMTYFAGAYLAVSLIVFARRWYGQTHGEDIHSGEAGYSWLVRYTRLPVGLCERLIVPVIIVAGVGYVLAHSVSIALGWWLMICGISLLIMARWEYARIWAQHRATVDDMARARAYEDRVKHYESKHGSNAGNNSDEEPDFADLN